MERFEEDVIYDLADIHDEMGSHFIKYPSSFEFIKHRQDYREKCETNLYAPERYSRGDRGLMVYQKRLKPPCYQIYLDFKGIYRLISDLDLPNDQFAQFYSKLIAGGDYAWVLDERYDQYQKYTVEVFGLLIRMDELNESNRRTKLPDPGQYATPPKYWYEANMELIQIWRTRVFRSSAFTPTTTNPLTPYQPTFPYLEQRWHPTITNITFGFNGLSESSGRHSFSSPFFTETHQILTRSPLNSGRPPRSGSFKTLKEFYCAVRKVYRQLAQNSSRPSQKAIALRMKFSMTTFNRYWARTRIRWIDAHELFKSELIPPQVSNARFDE